LTTVSTNRQYQLASIPKITQNTPHEEKSEIRMPRLIILIAILGIALILWHKITSASGEQRKKLVLWSIIGSLIAILGLLAITGHLNIITAAIAGMVALIPRALPLLKYLPFVSSLYKQGRQNNQQTQSPPPRGKQRMSVEEAVEVLGLKPGYTKEDVILAHRRMMQKVHPDRGGSDYLAAQINKAKETLLG
jgi:DnaJ family protein C protein 19